MTGIQIARTANWLERNLPLNYIYRSLLNTNLFMRCSEQARTAVAFPKTIMT